MDLPAGTATAALMGSGSQMKIKGPFTLAVAGGR